MRLLATLALSLTIVLGQTATASPRTDAEYIADRVLSLETEGLADMLKQPFVRFFRQELSKHAAHLKNEERFAELIPDATLVPWLKRTREIYIERLVDIAEAEDLQQYVALLKSHDGKADFEAANEGIQRVAIGSAANVFASLFKVGPEMREYLNTTTLADHPYLIDILETPGVFQFSNRILKNQLIAKIRAGT